MAKQFWKPGQLVTIKHRVLRIEKIPESCSGFFCNLCKQGPCRDKKRACKRCIPGCAGIHLTSNNSL